MIRDQSCCGRNWPLSKRPMSRQHLRPHATFTFYGGMAYLRTLASSLRSWVLWGRLHARVVTSWGRTLKSFRTGLGPSGKLTEWQAHLWHFSRNPKRPRQAWKLIILQEQPVQDLCLWPSGFSYSDHCAEDWDTGTALSCWRRQGSPPWTPTRATQED